MANIGMRKLFIAKRLGVGQYDTENLESCGHAVSMSITVNKAEGGNYGDDVQVDVDSEFVSATITAGTTNVPAKFHNVMFGHALSDEDKTITRNKDDQAPYVGVGFIGVDKVDGVRTFVASFLPKVQFSEPDSTLNTKTNSITYENPSLPGTALAEDDGTWKVDHICDTEAEGIAWIKEKFGVEAQG